MQTKNQNRKRSKEIAQTKRVIWIIDKLEMNAKIAQTQLTVNFLPVSKLRPFFTCPPDMISRPDFISSSTLGPIFSVTDSLANRIWSCNCSGDDTGTPFTSNITSPGCNRAWRSIMPPANMRATTNWLCSSISTVSPSGSLGFRRKPTMRIVSAPGIMLSVISRNSFDNRLIGFSGGFAVYDRRPTSSWVSINALTCGLLKIRANSRASMWRSRLNLFLMSRHNWILSKRTGSNGSLGSSNVVSCIYRMAKQWPNEMKREKNLVSFWHFKWEQQRR